MPDEDANNPRVELTELDQGMNGSLENILPIDDERNISYFAKIKSTEGVKIKCN